MKDFNCVQYYKPTPLEEKFYNLYYDSLKEYTHPKFDNVEGFVEDLYNYASKISVKKRFLRLHIDKIKRCKSQEAADKLIATLKKNINEVNEIADKYNIKVSCNDLRPGIVIKGGWYSRKQKIMVFEVSFNLLNDIIERKEYLKSMMKEIYAHEDTHRQVAHKIPDEVFEKIYVESPDSSLIFTDPDLYDKKYNDYFTQTLEIDAFARGVAQRLKDLNVPDEIMLKLLQHPETVKNIDTILNSGGYYPTFSLFKKFTKYDPELWHKFLFKVYEYYNEE
jgi:hypothetical protein